MDVHEIEVVVLGHLAHLGRQRERERRVGLKEWIGLDDDFVEKYFLREVVLPVRTGERDEVPPVTALGELRAQLGGHDARAAEGGVAGDADLARPPRAAPGGALAHGRSPRAEPTASPPSQAASAGVRRRAPR